jgi:RNA polymerase sigma-70 factor (ECF subfamily)
MDVTRQSLLVRARDGVEEAWNDLVDLYRPLILSWLRRHGVPGNDLDDLSQDILLTVLKHLPSFSHSGNRGAFRAWLRTIVCHRTTDYWRSRDPDTLAVGGSGVTEALQQLQDPSSDLNRYWDEEHDRYVFRCLLDLVEQEFEPITVQAFRRMALDGASGAEVARELGVAVGTVYSAKSRVLRRIRQEAEGLID